jgi:hypothetical protein
MNVFRCSPVDIFQLDLSRAGKKIASNAETVQKQAEF